MELKQKACKDTREKKVAQESISWVFNNIFTPPSTPVNREEDQPEQDFNKAVGNEFIHENFVFERALKQQQQQQQQIPPRQQACSIHEITSVEKGQLFFRDNFLL